MERYGLKNPDGTVNIPRRDHVSAVVVSVLQAGAFFGALTSAPISGKHISLLNKPYGRLSHNIIVNTRTAYLGRKKTLLPFCAIFFVGAVSNL